MNIRPIKKNLTLKDQAYQAIKEAIYSNTLKPGTPLTEEQLSSTLAISRTPIRSALQMLVYEKLATTDSTGHIYVSTVTEKDVRNATVLRSVLEPMVIQEAQFPIPEDYLTKLQQIYLQQESLFHENPENNFRYAEIDFEFHCLLSQLCENEFLIDIIKQLNTIMIRINILSGTLKSHMQDALNEHYDILKYLENNQRDFAKLAMEKHIKNVEERMFSNKEN